MSWTILRAVRHVVSGVARYRCEEKERLIGRCYTHLRSHKKVLFDKLLRRTLRDLRSQQKKDRMDEWAKEDDVKKFEMEMDYLKTLQGLPALVNQMIMLEKAPYDMTRALNAITARIMDKDLPLLIHFFHAGLRYEPIVEEINIIIIIITTTTPSLSNFFVFRFHIFFF